MDDCFIQVFCDKAKSAQTTDNKSCFSKKRHLREIGIAFQRLYRRKRTLAFNHTQQRDRII